MSHSTARHWPWAERTTSMVWMRHITGLRWTYLQICFKFFLCRKIWHSQEKSKTSNNDIEHGDIWCGRDTSVTLDDHIYRVIYKSSYQCKGQNQKLMPTDDDGRQMTTKDDNWQRQTKWFLCVFHSTLATQKHCTHKKT